VADSVPNFTPSQKYQREMFRKGLRTSIGAHSALIIFAIIAGFTLSRQPAKFTQSIRVDLVALPDLKKKDMAKITPDDLQDLSEKLSEASKSAKKTLENTKREAAKPKSEPEPEPDAMAMKKKQAKPNTNKDALKSAIDRIRALEEIESEVKKPKTTQKVAAKGNQISKGAGATGEVATGDLNAYISKMQVKLRDNWNLPVWLAKQTQLKALVVVFLDRKGFVTNAVLSRSSGDKQFDEYALKTVRISQPFGPPPSELIEDGATLAFPL
jgi:protein TonB